MLDTRRVERRERWFLEGAAALRRTVAALSGPGDPPFPAGELYACPCCLGLFDRDDLEERLLTVEHVPPESVGGRELVLTCAACNGTAGGQFDAHAAHREALFDFLAGRGPDRALRAEFTIGGTRTHGNIQHAGDAFLLRVAPQASDPREHEAMTRTLDAWAASGEVPTDRMGFRLTRRVYEARARVSWIRAAYLAGFAAWGWRYVFLPHLNPLRAQLADPAAELLPPLALVDVDAPPGRRGIFLVQEPRELRSLAVALGRYTVFLPGLEEPQPVDDLAAALARAPKPFAWTGKEAPWPAEPRYALDR
jgi:hypothetical protein